MLMRTEYYHSYCAGVQLLLKCLYSSCYAARLEGTFCIVQNAVSLENVFIFMAQADAIMCRYAYSENAAMYFPEKHHSELFFTTKWASG